MPSILKTAVFIQLSITLPKTAYTLEVPPRSSDKYVVVGCLRMSENHLLPPKRGMPVREHPAVFMAKPDMTTPTVRFFDSGKQKTDPPPDFKIFRNRNAHLYQLGAKSTPGTGDFDDMGRGNDHL